MTAATAPRRTHPVSPVAHAGRVFPAVLLATLAAVNGPLAARGPVVMLAATFGVSVVVALVVAGAAFLGWQRRTFWFDADGDFRMASGVLTRRERRLQLSRLQGVEVSQPLIARLLGLAEVTIEVAGAGESRARVQYLSLADGVALRDEVIARAAGLHPTTAAAPERPLVTVPPGDLLVSLLLSTETIVAAVLTVVLVVAGWWAMGPGGLVLLIFGGAVPLVSAVAQFTRFYGFTVAESPDGLRLRGGLLHVTAQTIPPGRVQAVAFVQPVLWWRKDWVRLELNVAGLPASEDQQDRGQHVLLPVAPYPVARAVLARVLPGVDVREIPLRPPPARARQRAWIQYPRLGVGVDDRVLVVRGGRLIRRLVLVPHARCQSVRVTQGPWQRRLGLASMHVDSVPGPVRVSALHRDAAEARALADAQHVRALAALRAGGSGRWMRPGQQP